MSFNESSKVVILYTVLGVHENAMKNFLPKHSILRWLDRVSDRARSGPQHGANHKNIAKQNHYGGPIRPHDSYQL